MNPPVDGAAALKRLIEHSKAHGLFGKKWAESFGLHPAPSEENEKYQRLMPVAVAYADQSKYKGTHVGAVIFGQHREPLSAGWNGAPRGSRADSDSRSVERDERLRWVVHAEANAIANAARSGARLEGSTLIVTHAPCLACATLIVQAGISRVITHTPDPHFLVNWGEQRERSLHLFHECGVLYIEIDKKDQ